MKAQFLEYNKKYDGTQLQSLFAYMNFGLLGDSIVAWRGPCDVSFEHMVDGEDVRAGSAICGSDMLHFIVEKFDVDLFAAVSLQRLLASLTKDILASRKHEFVRDGDDLYLGEKKFSISIATVSPTSALIHFAVNVSTAGTPVPTIGLQDLKLDPREFALTLMEKFVQEINTIREATQKVKWVR